MEDYSAIIDGAVERLRPLGAERGKTGLILGSGLGGYAEGLENARSLSYAQLPGFPVSGVPGHAGRGVVGDRFGRRVIVMQGRFHFYEGYPAPLLALGVRVMRRLGVETLLLTNAAGGINPTFKAGDLMQICDHIIYNVPSPLIGANIDELGVRFPDMSEVYSKRLRKLVEEAAAEVNVPLKSGVYIQTSGPNYETPAEIRAFGRMGADAVGMSTAVEAVAARHCGMEVLGISCISNLAAGISPEKLSHKEVQETADKTAPMFRKLVTKAIEKVTAGK